MTKDIKRINYLIDTLLTQQDIYASVCEQLDF